MWSMYLISQAATIFRIAVDLWSSWTLLSEVAFEGAATLVRGISWRGKKKGWRG